MFLSGAECPFTCSFCDLWRWTIDGPTPPGALSIQLERILQAHDTPAADRLKLYVQNGGTLVGTAAVVAAAVHLDGQRGGRAEEVHDERAHGLLPAEGDARAVTYLERKGRPPTALVHDPKVLGDPQLAETVLAAVRFVIEKDRGYGQVDATATSAAAPYTTSITGLRTHESDTAGRLPPYWGSAARLLACPPWPPLPSLPPCPDERACWVCRDWPAAERPRDEHEGDADEDDRQRRHAAASV